MQPPGWQLGVEGCPSGQPWILSPRLLMALFGSVSFAL